MHRCQICERWILILANWFAVLVCAATNLSAQVELTGTTMGPIEYRVVVYDEVEDREKLHEQIDASLEQVNQLMSTYIDSSDVSRFNQGPANRWIDIDPLTFSVIEKSQEFSRLTHGAFDITVGPAVKLWRFGPEKSGTGLPSDAEVAELQEFVGYQHLEVRSDPPAIKKRHPRTEIDLSAIAKGFAVDQVGRLLLENKFENFMVEVGGEVVVRGQKETGAWRIGIEQPTENQRNIAAVVELRDQAMATSGDYRNFFEHDGRRYSHTIDPANCRPVANRVASCTVIAADCLTADAMATALLVMGEKKGLTLCLSNGWQCSFIQRIDGNLKTSSTDQFPIVTESNLAAATGTSIWPAFIGALVVFSLAIAGMAIGAIFNNRPITGSCGGMAANRSENGESSCSLCQTPAAGCPDTKRQSEEAV